MIRQSGLFSARPLPQAANGSRFYATDTQAIYFSAGNFWMATPPLDKGDVAGFFSAPFAQRPPPGGFVGWVFVDSDTGNQYEAFPGAWAAVTVEGGGGGGPGGGVALIASGVAALGVAAIASGAAAAVVSVAAPGVLATDTIIWNPNADISAVTGYSPVAGGGLIIYPYPTAGFVNFKVGNPTAASITPGAVTLNWRVVR